MHTYPNSQVLPEYGRRNVSPSTNFAENARFQAILSLFWSISGVLGLDLGYFEPILVYLTGPGPGFGPLLVYLGGLGPGFGPLLVYLGGPGPGFGPLGGSGAWIWRLWGVRGLDLAHFWGSRPRLDAIVLVTFTYSLICLVLA